MNILRDVPTMGEPDHRTGEPGGHAEILYENVRVPYENIVGNPGDGFALAQKRLGPGRIHHAMRWLGQSRRAFDMLCERALSRFTHGSLLAEKQMIQDWIAESYAEMQAARLLTLQAAWRMDQLHAAGRHHSDARVDIATIKFWGARVLYNVMIAPSRSTAPSATPPTCPSSRCTARPGLLASTTVRTRSTRSPSPARC